MTIREFIIANIDTDFDEELPFSTFDRSVKKSDIITDYGQMETKAYFIKSGIVQVELASQKEVKILDFFFKNSFCFSYSSFINKTVSDVRIKAITDCELEFIEIADLQAAYQHSLIINKLGRIVTERLYAKRVQREKMLLTKGSKENYLFLIDKYPEVVQHIPLKDIAKYLGITPESLSRIRKSIIS